MVKKFSLEQRRPQITKTSILGKKRFAWQDQNALHVRSYKEVDKNGKIGNFYDMYTWALSLVDLGNISGGSFQGLTVQSIRFYDIRQLASQMYLQSNCRNNNKKGLIYC